MIEIGNVSLLRQRLGEEIAVSDWLEVTQARIDQFAEATCDQQWIHVDVSRAAAESPFKATIAHGFLTLSLLSPLIHSAVRIGDVGIALNCGLNRVRFVSPLPAGSRIRGRFTPVAVKEVKGGTQVIWSIAVERENGDKPCMVTEWVVRYYSTEAGDPSGGP